MMPGELVTPVAGASALDGTESMAHGEVWEPRTSELGPRKWAVIISAHFMPTGWRSPWNFGPFGQKRNSKYYTRDVPKYNVFSERGRRYPGYRGDGSEHDRYRHNIATRILAKNAIMAFVRRRTVARRIHARAVAGFRRLRTVPVYRRWHAGPRARYGGTRYPRRRYGRR